MLLMVPGKGVMSNVLQLFEIENPPDPKTIVAIAVASILTSKDQLARVAEELSSISMALSGISMHLATPMPKTGSCMRRK